VTAHIAGGPTRHFTTHVKAWRLGTASTSRLPWVGSKNLNGVPGREVVLGNDDSPASFVRYHVVQFDDGRLSALPSPSQYGWWVGGVAALGGDGFTCRRHTVTTVDSTVHLGRHGHRLHPYRTMLIRRWQWSGTGWTLTRTRSGPARHFRHLTGGRGCGGID
jgi:hypothetical protein